MSDCVFVSNTIFVQIVQELMAANPQHISRDLAAQLADMANNDIIEVSTGRMATSTVRTNEVLWGQDWFNTEVGYVGVRHL